MSVVRGRQQLLRDKEQARKKSVQQEASAGGRGVAAGCCGRCHVAVGPE